MWEGSIRAMAASLFRAMMCFLKSVYLFLSCFPETMYCSLADVSSWRPIMPRSISGLVMQLMRVAHVGGGGFRAEVTSEMCLRSVTDWWRSKGGDFVPQFCVQFLYPGVAHVSVIETLSFKDCLKVGLL